MSRPAPIPTPADRPPAAGGISALLAGLRPELDRVDDLLRAWVAAGHPLLAEKGGALVEASGKRLRPALVLLGARLLGRPGGEDVRLAAVMELLHTASLVHDDIVDDAPLRRGRAAAHAAWGTPLTVLLGDYLFITAIDLAQRSSHRRAAPVLTEVAARMVEGEILETEAAGDLGLTETAYLDIVARKTSALFGGCCRMGAVLAGAGPEDEAALEAAGADLGTCFQIVDDLLDITGDEAALGKPVCSDLGEGRVTLPVIRLLAGNGGERASSSRDLVAGLLRRKRIPDRSRRALLAALEAAGALESTRRTAAEYAARASERFGRFPDGPARRTLTALAGAVARRDR